MYYGRLYEMLQKGMWKMVLSCDFYLKFLKIEEFHFLLVYCFETDHVRIIRKALFFCSKYFKCPIFSIFITWLAFEQQKESFWRTEIQLFDFRAFQLKIQMQSHDKIIFYLLVGAFILPHVKFLFSPLVTEVWELENGNNQIIQPTLDYAFGIALYVVEKDFCKKWFCIWSKLVLGRN